ncbi:MAG: hypothetical protein NT154_09920 [Verrucomicrobia bacterium]|nr:hypothetical protein [Verrucomicrobiota bacterium]
MKQCWRWVFLLILMGSHCPFTALAQIDPVKRELIQFGYNGALEGHSPLSAYAFYYRNEPAFLRTNLTLRLAVAPTYLDSELGISHAISEYTDVGIGVAGGGFADNFNEINQGTFHPSQSFTGYGAETSLSLYHLFNPGAMIPLNGLVRGIAHYSTYESNDSTDSSFQLPKDRGTFSVRTGLRWVGREPTLFPALGMELSAWYEGEFRTGPGTYGYGDRSVEPQSHLFWGEAMLAYTLPELKHRISLSLTAGTSINADRFSAYRLGSVLPLISEYPLSLPGYYYQEISAREFALVSGDYLMPLDKKQRWNLGMFAGTAVVDYLPGMEQPGNWHTGLGGGILYMASSWKVMLGYGYGIDAIRSHGRGAQSVGVLLQFDLGQARTDLLNPDQPSRWRGFQQIFNIFGR